MNRPDPAITAPDAERAASPENGEAGPAPGDAAATDPASPAPEGRATKFVFPSGSRPLDGYTIKRGVGRGGFGEVYFATSDAGKEVALKLIRRNLDVELRGVRQCLNLKHPNLVALYDLRTDDAGDQWVIMEYVPLGPGGGLSLEDAIDAHPNGMPEREVIAWMKGIASGVAYLHQSGIVHRDLKPGNIFRDVSSVSAALPGSRNGDGGSNVGGTNIGDVKIGDYGLAKFISASRRSGQTESVGTVHYMAPEIANGRYGREVDLYALGIILYEMLTGHVPFEGESIGEVLMKHLTAEPDLSVLKRPYRDIVRRLLAKDPSDRIASVTELIEQLPGERTVAGPQAPTSGEYPAYEPSASEASVDPGAGPYASPHGADADSDPVDDESTRYWSGRSPEDQHFEPSQPEEPHSEPSQPEEPLYGAAASVYRNIRDSDMPGVAKAALGFLAIAVGLMFLAGAGRLVVALGVVYAIYYVIYSFVAKPRRGPATPSTPYTPAAHGTSPDEAVPPPAVGQVVTNAGPTDAPPRRGHARQARRLRQTWREAARQQIVAKPLRQNATELFGSMLMAAGVCFLLAGLASVVATERYGVEPAPWFAWLTVTATLGSWAVLLTNKVTEGRVEDRVPMRGMLLVLGAVVGIVAGGISVGLPVGLPMVDNFGPDIDETVASEVFGLDGYDDVRRYRSGALVSVGMAVAYFATLFALVRWWRLAEYTRRKRLSLWSVAACVVAAWLVHLVWWFPQPTGAMVAGIVAVAVQLASPWLPPSKREALARGEVA
ncbi:MAG: protein kinase [Planctomycetota bacterium]